MHHIYIFFLFLFIKARLLRRGETIIELMHACILLCRRRTEEEGQWRVRSSLVGHVCKWKASRQSMSPVVNHGPCYWDRNAAKDLNPLPGCPRHDRDHHMKTGPSRGTGMGSSSQHVRQPLVSKSFGFCRQKEEKKSFASSSFIHRGPTPTEFELRFNQSENHFIKQKTSLICASLVLASFCNVGNVECGEAH